MVYAADIINETFEKTKQLFFPIKPKYWLRMGFVNMFSGGSSGSSGKNFSNSSSDKFGDMSFREAISTFNSKGLEFFSNYGYMVGIGFFLLYVIGLFFTYIGSVLTFVFFEGLFDKEFKIRKSFGKNKKLGVSLFAFRFVLGIINLILMLIIFSPVIFYFMNNNLVNFNLWLFVPMFFVLILTSIILSIILFLVNDFVIPIMYTKKYAFKSSWDYMIKFAKNKKMEIFLYYLIKLALGIGTGIISIFLLIPIFLVFLIIAIPFALIGVGLYFLLNSLNKIILFSVLGTYGFVVMFFFIYLLGVVFVPLSAFFRMYSLEMLKKLEEKS